MNRKEAEELLPIIKAFSEGRIIEFSSITDVSKTWREVTDFPIGMIKNFKFRIKPEYRPFANAEECWQEIEKHKYFGWIKGKDASIPSKFMIINSVRDEGVSITSGIDFTYSELIEYYTFIDGTPFGVRIY